MGIGGNTTAVLMRAVKTKDKNGNAVAGNPQQLIEVIGWLDYQAGQPSHLTYQAKLADTTHLWLCDYSAVLAGFKVQGLSMVIGSDTYEVLFIDDPMGIHDHLEVYLRYVGVG